MIAERPSKTISATSKELAWQVLGHYFTKQLVAGCDRRSLKGFTQDAESCFQEVRSWRKAVVILTTLITAGTGFGMLCYKSNLMTLSQENWLPFIYLLLSLFSFVVAFVYHYDQQPDRPDENVRLVALNWQVFRKTVVEEKIVEKLATELENGDITEVEKSCEALGQVIKGQMCQLYDDLMNICTGRTEDKYSNKLLATEQRFRALKELVQRLGYIAIPVNPKE